MKTIQMWKRNLLFTLLILLPFGLQAVDFVDQETPADVKPANTTLGTGWVLDFSDEFNGTEVDTDKWNIDHSSKSRAARPKLGIQNWMWKSYNVDMADGDLLLKVTKPNSNTMYCGSIHTANKYETTYGYFEARIKIAEAAKGTHTAFWLQGRGMSNVDGTANDGAEIDIFESAWLGDYTKSVVHIDGYGKDHKANTKQYNTPGIHSGYHLFAMHWTEEFMNIYYDGKLKVSYTDPKWIVKAKEYLWLSDGASFGYEGDHFTSQPFGDLTQAYFDYVRVWKFTGDGSGVVVDPNLVKNGDFDEYSTDWARSETDIILSESDYPLNGTNYCRMPSIPNARHMTQSIPVTAGETYQFEFSGRIQNSHSASAINNHSTKGPATLKAEIYANNSSIMELTTQSTTSTTLSQEFTIPTGISKVTLKISKDWNVAYVDKVSLMIPEAAAINDISKESTVKVFPNLCARGEHISVVSESQILNYSIYNLGGGLEVKADNVNLAQVDVYTGALRAGHYIIQVENTVGKISSTRVFIY